MIHNNENMERIDLAKLVKEVEYKAAQILLHAMQNGTVSDQEGREIASYILEKTEEIQSLDQVDICLTALTDRWQLFAPLQSAIQLKISESTTTQEALTKVKEQLATVTAE